MRCSPLLIYLFSLHFLINISAAALSGVFVPVVLDKMKLDPALSGSVILTTVTDMVGFFRHRIHKRSVPVAGAGRCRGATETGDGEAMKVTWAQVN